MRFYTLRRAWTSLLVVGVPLAFLTLAWTAFMGGRWTVAALAFVYLVIVACGRALAIKRELDERPYRASRVASQVARIRSTLPGAEELELPAPQLEPVVLEPGPVRLELETVRLEREPARLERAGRPVDELESLRLRAV